MFEWNRNIQILLNSIENKIKAGLAGEITLRSLAAEISYSEFYTTKHFKQLTGITLRNYLRLRSLAYSVIDLRDSDFGILDIALRYGFSSQAAYTRAFKNAYGVTPNEYRLHPKPLTLRNKIDTFDPYFLEMESRASATLTAPLPALSLPHMNADSAALKPIRCWIELIPAHKILYIKNYDSHGYFDFWGRQTMIPGADRNSVLGILDSVKENLDGEKNQIGICSGHVRFIRYETDGRAPECYGIRVPTDYNQEIPEPILCDSVAEGEYIVFAHPAFDYMTMSKIVGDKVNEVSERHPLEGTGYMYDEQNHRIRYFYHDPDKLGYRVLRPVKKK